MNFFIIALLSCWDNKCVREYDLHIKKDLIEQYQKIEYYRCKDYNPNKCGKIKQLGCKFFLKNRQEVFSELSCPVDL